MSSVRSSQPIGVFDSGLGGLSVLREIAVQLPNENLIYVADSAHAPYGAKTAEYIAERCMAISQFLLDQQVKLIVVACNTATAYAVDLLRHHLTIPVIGLEPAVKPAVQLTKTGVVGVLATQQTANSERLKRLIADYAQGIKVVVQACPKLVEHVEQGDFDSVELQLLLQTYLAPLQAQQVDTLVLGCTHYPFLSDTLTALSEGKMTILETSQPVARRVIQLLQLHQVLHVTNPKRTVKFYSSLCNTSLETTAQRLWQGELQLLPLPEAYM